MVVSTILLLIKYVIEEQGLRVFSESYSFEIV